MINLIGLAAKTLILILSSFIRGKVMSDSYYDILGVDKDANQSAIKKEYRKLAQKLHTDKNKGDETASEKFKKINEAYSTLSDPQKRMEYDASIFGNRVDFGDNFRNSESFNDLFLE